MTIEDVSQVFYINKEIKSLQLEIASLEQKHSYYKPNIITDMPRGGEGEDKSVEYVDEKMLLEDMLEYSLQKLQKERKKVEVFLREIEDAEIRAIIRFRCVNNMKWEDVGFELGLERTTVSKKFYKFFKDSHNSREVCDTV